jgi:hypothetical protein
MCNPYSLFEDHPLCKQATEDMTCIINGFIDELRKWKTRYEDCGASDTAARECIQMVLEEKLFD